MNAPRLNPETTLAMTLALGGSATSAYMIGWPELSTSMAPWVFGISASCLVLTLLYYAFQDVPRKFFGKETLTVSATRLYEATENGLVGELARRTSQGSPLTWYCYFAQPRKPIYGILPPSTNLQSIQTKQLHFRVVEGRVVANETGTEIQWQDLQMSVKDRRALTKALVSLQKTTAPHLI